MFNTTNERKRSKDDGNKTAVAGSREENAESNEDKFRNTDRSGRFSNHSYSI